MVLDNVTMLQGFKAVFMQMFNVHLLNPNEAIGRKYYVMSQFAFLEINIL
jgi:hypothetical protein